MTALIVIVVLLLLMWMLLIRPQRRRQTQQEQLLSSLQIGDEIVTAGGMYGRIEEVRDDEVTLEIAPGTSVRIAKRAVAAMVSPEEEEPEEIEEEPELEAHEEQDEPEAEAAREAPAAERR